MKRYTKALLISLAALWGGSAAQKAFGETIVGLASWQKEKEKEKGKARGNPKLTIKLEEQLSKKQLKLLNSGFSTYSAIEIILPEGKFTQKEVLFKSECTIKYDTWEEVYDTTFLTTGKTRKGLKNLDLIKDKCLTATITSHPSLSYFYKNGGILHATMKLDQISKDRAEKIRQWLIKQQGGVVKGLFAHMLGDLSLSEMLHISIHIPPYRAKVPKKAYDLEEEIEVIAIYPRMYKKE